MTKTIMFAIIALGIGILFSSLSNNALAQNSAHLGLEEDQALVCIQDNYDADKEICKVIDILDLLSENQEGKLQSEFYPLSESDVFPIESLD